MSEFMFLHKFIFENLHESFARNLKTCRISFGRKNILVDDWFKILIVRKCRTVFNADLTRYPIKTFSAPTCLISPRKFPFGSTVLWRRACFDNSRSRCHRSEQSMPLVFLKNWNWKTTVTTGLKFYHKVSNKGSVFEQQYSFRNWFLIFLPSKCRSPNNKSSN